jgi:NAD(P)-dependent dehydrogenase (short-subunit alcohol dehydrogenase family)
MKIEGAVIAVTGGASGLGEGAVRAIVKKGGKALIFDRDEEKGVALAKELGDDNALFALVDVTKEDTIKAGIAAGVKKFGAIHGVINSAGIGSATRVVSKGRVHPQSLFDTVIGINLGGTFNVIRLVAAQIASQKPLNQDGERGVVINVASVAAFEGQQGQVAYSASKGGVVGMTVPLAREFAPLGIRVLTIAPGIMETPMLGKLPENVRQNLINTIVFPNRLGTGEDFGQLCSSIIETTYLNAETIRFDAGVRMNKL